MKLCYISTLVAKFGTVLQSPFLALIRICWGYFFFQAGLGKLMHMENTVSFFQQVGVPLGEFSAYIVAILELVGGICFILGLCTRFSALVLAVIMILALVIAHTDAITYFTSNPHVLFSQAPFSYLFTSLVLLFFGAGSWSLDKVFGKR
jgi:putative oxidoreductase